MDSFNDLTSPASLLATRRSGKARDMVAPGPDAAALRTILTSAMRVPDHGKLAPWRFVIVGDGRREALSAEMVAAYVAEKPDAGRLEIDAIRGFALQAPNLVIVLARPNLESHIPEWEQLLSVGAACGLLCAAAHAQGFVANWLTGWAAYAPGVAALVAEPGERIAGYVFIGTPARPLEERPRPDYDAVVRRW
ncbi:nitroreductase family protein [Polymorphobacter fuscus]|uniref:Putative NAD(P)H nitroreductase n=1 Tax=Sandarakinorhabdus fusca TaxID=1439888 RepID=A0A7C9KW68_9SPHN|nr:nitroreductase family protein [Polymorphobacter fuscus]KAB7647984.1 nitroreductase [Polymorphobacter fuscus]MQT16745.1 nitroreductase [Polymorphobacter fuscus]NJC09267.1 nitroreductase [Polymorphobacter fuscus]